MATVLPSKRPDASVNSAHRERVSSDTLPPISTLATTTTTTAIRSNSLRIHVVNICRHHSACTHEPLVLWYSTHRPAPGGGRRGADCSEQPGPGPRTTRAA